MGRVQRAQTHHHALRQDREGASHRPTIPASPHTVTNTPPQVDAENTELKNTLAKERTCVNAMMDLVKDFCMNKSGGAYSENLDIVLMRQCNALVAKVHGTDAEGLMALR